MTLPLSIQSRFTETYEGNTAARFNNSLEAKNFEAALQQAGASYRTKIIKSKKSGRQFVVTLLEAL
jgi:hypothetical protein